MKTFKQFNEGLKTMIGVGAALATPYLLKKFAKPKTDKMLDKGRKELNIGGDKRSGTDFQKGVDALKQKKEDKKKGKTRVFGDPTGQYSDFFK
jgi:hypothetical protein